MCWAHHQGIDKADVRFVVHYTLSKALEACLLLSATWSLQSEQACFVAALRAADLPDLIQTSVFNPCICRAGDTGLQASAPLRSQR